MTINREHLDAETMAAWIDGGLDAASRAAAEAHASNCERCQMLLATVAKTLPADEIAGLNAAAASGTPRFWRWWLAPIAATAAAVTLWVVVPQDPMQPSATQAGQSDVAPAPAAVAPQRAPAPVVGAPSTKPAAPPSADARFADAPRLAAGTDTGAKTLADAQSNRADAAATRDRQEEKREASVERAVAAPRLEAAPPPAPSVPAEPARDTAAGAELGAVSQLRKQIAPREFVSPDPRRRWRVSQAMVEFSQDGGSSWVPVRLNPGEAITAGAAPAPLVCWMVGRAGLVLLATDGTNFTRLPFPERVDLASVAATDARRATVTTADGRTFETADNGRTWRNR